MTDTEIMHKDKKSNRFLRFIKYVLKKQCKNNSKSNSTDNIDKKVEGGA